MKARIGVDAVVDDVYLESFPSDVQIVRIAEEPEGEIEVDFWIPGLPFNLAQRQWPHLKGVKVVQVPWAGVDAWLKFVPPGVTLCDARGVHDIPTAEWAVTAVEVAASLRPGAAGSVGHWQRRPAPRYDVGARAARTARPRR